MICSRSARLLLAFCVLAALSASGEAPDSDETSLSGEASLFDEASDPAAVEGDVWEADEPLGEPESRVWDPWEGMNRGFFAFNEYADRWVLEPLATGWDTVVPEPVQQGIDNFFDNLGTPRRIVNDVLQAKPAKAGSDLGRLLLNTTFGIGGLFDVAGAQGYPPADEDFGQTLGVWGTPAGPYLVLPFFGPSSPRDAVGLAFDSFVLTPEYFFVPFYVSYTATGTRVLNDRALALETVAAERAAAFDFYAAVRSAYVQYRENQVRDREETPEDDDEDLYYFEDDDEVY
jgi:phospholipid-binding lipoprotein MlaA